MGFIARTLVLLSVLYGMVFVIGDVYLLHSEAPIWSGIAFVTVLIGVQYLFAPWLIRFFLSIEWDEDALPASLRSYVEHTCRQNDLPNLRVGIIESGTPNAFAFGRVRSDACIVVTRGLLDVLTEEELQAVLAHEIGHVKHYDFAVMALAALAPMLLYNLYAFTRSSNHTRPLAYSAYLAYWIGRFLVLMLNRTREYGADHFSATACRAPNALATALVKIAYGRMLENANAKHKIKSSDSGEKSAARKSVTVGRTVALMGIMSAANNDALVLSTTPEQAARVMRWDLVNPWSRFYELSSTHPLTAMRLRALNREAIAQGQNVAYPLPQDSRVRWAQFPMEFLFWVAPLVCGFLLVTWEWLGSYLRQRGLPLPPHVAPWLLALLGCTWGMRITFRYRGLFERKQVESLLDDLGVSQMQPRAVELHGEIIGNGVPGAFWSPDLVLRDETGMMFIYYRSSIPLGRLFFAISSADRLIGEQVVVHGWYRRGLRPYVELSRIEARVSKRDPDAGMISLFGKDGQRTPIEYEQFIEKSYSRWIQLGASAACTAAGIIWLLLTLG